MNIIHRSRTELNPIFRAYTYIVLEYCFTLEMCFFYMIVKNQNIFDKNSTIFTFHLFGLK